MGAARDRGPRRKAPEVDAKTRKARQSGMLPRRVPVWYPREVFLFAVVWMLREIELTQIRATDVLIDTNFERVTLIWRKSKKDQAAGGTMKVLSCLCGGNKCDRECPYFVTADLMSKVMRFSDGDGPLCWRKKPGLGAEPATKSQITKSWSMAFNMKVSGHCGRRTGALNYIRLGWSIAQVAYLGRWKSGVIYDYVQTGERDQCDGPGNLAPITPHPRMKKAS